MEAALLPRSRVTAFLFGTVALQGLLFFFVLYFHYLSPREFSRLEVSGEQITTPIVSSNSEPTSSETTVSPEIQSEATAATKTEGGPLPNETKLDSESKSFIAGIPNATSRLEYVVVAGDSLITIWNKNNAPAAGALRASQTLKEISPDATQLKSGEKLELFFSDNGDIVGFRKKIRGGKVVTIKGGSQDGYVAEVSESRVIKENRVVVGKVQSSFSAAAFASNVPYQTIDEFVDLFGGKIDFRRDFQPGDQFVIIYTEILTSSGELLDIGPISAASVEINGKFHQMIRYAGKDNVARYYDDTGNPVGDFFLRYPVQFTRISSVFSDARFHPVLKIKRPHNGVDFAAPVGAPVRAVADGRIISAGFQSEAGNMVKIQHSDRFATAYLHMSRIAPGITVGTVVHRGELVGAVGMTGLATGPHLHFSLYENGKYVDPLTTALPQEEKGPHQTISVEYLKAAVQTLNHYHSIQDFASIFEPGVHPGV